jgi:hypothetical protein
VPERQSSEKGQFVTIDCIGCGIGCDGTMYKSVDLYKNDRRNLPEGCCKIYEIRPTVCAQ